MTDNDARRRAAEEAAYWYARLSADDGPAERQRFAAWLAGGEEQELAWARLERTAALLRQAEAHPAIPALRADARRMPMPAAFPAPPPAPSPRRHGRLVLASLALALGIGAAAFWPLFRAGEERPAAALMATRYATAIGEHRTIGLPDGSEVTLDTDSAVSLPPWGAAAGAQRHVTLERGQALFAVAKDQARPFVVTSAGRSVEALGTRFMVREEGPRFAVALLEGKVAVAIPAADRPRAILQPGDTLVQERGAVSLAHGKAADMAGWASGRLNFDAVPLRRIVAEMNRYSTRKIVLADEALAARPFSGTFATNGAGALVEALEAYRIARVVAADESRIVIGAR